MQTSPPTLEALSERVATLESQNRRFKTAGIALLALPIAALLMAQARPSRTAEADKFVLKDPDGRTRAEMSFWEGEPLLAFYDANGKRTLALSGTVLALRQSKDKGEGIRLDAGAPSFGPSAKKLGGRALTFYDDDGAIMAGLATELSILGPTEVKVFPIEPF